MRWFLLLLVSLLFSPSLGYGTNYYIKNGGNDSNTGLSDAQAWETLAKISGRAFSAGDSILFKRGSTWVGKLTITSSGTSGNNIVYGAYGTGAKPYINANGANDYAISSDGKNYVTLLNLNAGYGSYYSINVEGNPTGWVCDSLYVHHADAATGGGNGLNFKAAHSCTFRNCETTLNEWNGLACQAYGASSDYGDILVENCHSHNNDHTGFDFQVSELYNTKNLQNVTMRYCVADSNTDQGIFLDQETGRSITNFTVTYSRFSDNGLVGVFVEDTNRTPPYTVGFTLENCTITGNGQRTGYTGRGIVLYAQGAILKNNIIYNNEVTYASKIEIEGNDGGGTSNTFTHNLIYNSGSSTIFSYEGITTYAGFTSAGYNASGLNENPDFVSASNYNIQSVSPCFNAGTDLGFTLDIIGTTVPQGIAPDIGAYERITGPPQHVFYVDMTGGNDSNAGTLALPWKTVSKVNGYAFSVGDTIKFKYGETWRESLVASVAGTASSPVVYTAYGDSTLGRPKLLGSANLSSWTSYQALGNGNVIYIATYASNPSMLYHNWNRGFKKALIADCTTQDDWCYSSGVVYLCSAAPPGSDVEVTSLEYGITCAVNYNTFDNLDIRGFWHHTTNITGSYTRTTHCYGGFSGQSYGATVGSIWDNLGFSYVGGRGNYIAYTTVKEVGGNGIDCQSDSMTVEYCNIINAHHAGIDSKTTWGNTFRFNTVEWDDFFINQGAEQYTGIYAGDTDSAIGYPKFVHIYGNLIYGVPFGGISSGIALGGGTDALGNADYQAAHGDSIFIDNNTIASCHVGITFNNGTGKVWMRNNIIYHYRSTLGVAFRCINTTNKVVNYNDWYVYPTLTMAQFGASTGVPATSGTPNGYFDYATFDLYRIAQPTFDSYGNDVDPVFFDQYTGNYTLASTSPLINAGTYIDYYPLDRMGVTVPYGDGSDYGAWEYTGIVAPPVEPPVEPPVGGGTNDPDPGVYQTGGANHYYVDSVNGNDTFSGNYPTFTSGSNGPWASLSKITGRTFSPGDSIFFKCNGSWRGQLTIPSGGNATSRVYYGSYGTGSSPIIYGSTNIPTWTLYLSYPNLYRAPLSSSYGAIGTSGAVRTFDNVYHNWTRNGQARSSFLTCTNEGDWYYDGSYVYLYTTGGNPGSDVEACRYQYGIYCDKPYVTIRNIKTLGAWQKFAQITSNAHHNILVDCYGGYNGYSHEDVYGVWDRLGFCIDGADCLLRRCISMECGGNGFDVRGSRTTLESCAAYNSHHGNYDIKYAPVRDVTYKYCLADYNSKFVRLSGETCNGFYCGDIYGIVRNIKYLGCIAKNVPYCPGIDTGFGTGAGACADSIFFINCVSYNNYYSFAILTGYSAGSYGNIFMYNNIAYPGANYYRHIRLCTSQGKRINYNNWYNTQTYFAAYGGGGTGVPDQPSMTWSAYRSYSTSPGTNGLDINSKITDPQFVNVTDGNFHLLSTSPCIDAGMNVSGNPYFHLYDGDGTGLPQNSVYDMGAFEYYTGGGNPSSPSGHYVSNSGNDTASGSSVSTAWKSLSTASGHIYNPGDTLYIATGSTFNESLSLTGLTGTASSPIVITTYGTSSSPRIIGGNTLNNGIVLVNSSYVKVLGLTIKYFTTSGIDVTNSNYNTIDGCVVDSCLVGSWPVGLYFAKTSTNNTIQNCTISNCKSTNVSDGAGIAIGSSYDTMSYPAITNTIKNNTVSNCYVGISVRYKATGNTIDGNLVYGNTSYGISAIGSSTLGNTIKYNKVYQNGTGIRTGNYGVIIANVLYSNAVGIDVYGTPTASMENIALGNNNTIYNNSLYGNNTGVLFTNGAGSISGNTFKNNIVSEGNQGIFFTLANGDYALNTFGYNRYYRAASNVYFTTNATSMSIGAWKNICSSDASSTWGDPLFTSPPATLTLQAASACIDSGVTLGAPYDYGLDPLSSWPASVLIKSQSVKYDKGAFCGYVTIPKVNDPTGFFMTAVRYDSLKVHVTPHHSASVTNFGVYSYATKSLVSYFTGKQDTVKTIGGLTPGVTYTWQAIVDSAGTYGYSNSYTLATPAKPVLTLSYPNGGETYQAGSSISINWDYTSTIGDSVKLWYSTNSGTSWIAINLSVSATAKSYSWTIPSVKSNTCLVKVYAKNDSTIVDQSNGAFAIWMLQTHYVDSQYGDDDNSGIHPYEAWATIAKVNAYTPAAGDSILFSRGGSWREYLTLSNNGTTANPIVYGAYGVGSLPILYGSMDLSDSSLWTYSSSGTYDLGNIINGESFEPTTYISAYTSVGTPIDTTFQSYSGQYSVKMDSTECLAKTFTATDTLFFSGYVFLYTPGGQSAEVLNLYYGGTPTRLMTIYLRGTDNTTGQIEYYNDPSSSGGAGNALVVSTGAWHKLELMWVKSATVGKITCWLDGAVAIAVTGLNTGTNDCTQIRFGQPATGTGWTSYWDDISLDNSARIVTETGSFWYAHVNTPDVGSLFFNGGTYVGTKKWNKVNITQQGDFYSQEADSTVWMYSTINPGNAYDSIEAGLNKDILSGGSKSNLIIQNLSVKFGGAHGYNASATNNVTIQDCVFSYLGGGKQGGTDSTFYGNGIQFIQSTNNCKVRRNTVFECFDAGISWQNPSGSSTANNLLFNNNIVYNCEYNFEFFNSVAGCTMDSIFILNNTTYNSGGQLFHSQRPVKNNSNCLMMQQNAGTSGNLTNFVIKNNIFRKNEATSNLLYLASWNDPEDITMDYNLWYGTSYAMWLGTYCATFANLKSTSGKEANGISGDPMFVNPYSNFSLKTNSPAINRGASVGLTIDFYSKELYKAPDIGAIEWRPGPQKTKLPDFIGKIFLWDYIYPIFIK